MTFVSILNISIQIKLTIIPNLNQIHNISIHPLTLTYINIRIHPVNIQNIFYNI